MPLLHIKCSRRWLEYWSINLRLTLIVLNLRLTLIVLILIIWSLLVSLSINQQRSMPSTFLCRNKIIPQEIVKEIIWYIKLLLLILQISFLSSLLLNFQDKLFTLFWFQSIYYLPKEFSLWNNFILSMWIWQVMENFWAMLFDHVPAVLDA